MLSRFNIFLVQNPVSIWLRNKLNPRQFVLFSAFIVGQIAGLAAVALKFFVHFIETKTELISANYRYIVATLPFIGISLCSLYVIYLNRNKLGRGLANILHAIARKSSYLPSDQVYSHIISSGITVGFGGSSGLESPIVTTGSAIGSNVGRVLRLTYKERTLLLACGAAAGIAGAFNTPIAGVLFALEVLLVEANISAFVPLLIASAAGALSSKMILHEDILLHFSLREPFNYNNTIFYTLLGVICGFASVYYSKAFLLTENWFKKINSTLAKVVLAGVGLFCLILLFPPLFGEGYHSIKTLAGESPLQIMQNSLLGKGITLPFFLISILFIIILKPFATGMTLGGGGNGGNFAPSLFSGALLGYLFSESISLTGVIQLPVANFTLVAMAGLLSGVFHAPLTGIFLIAEITGGYELIIPLMIVSAISYGVARYFMPLSIDYKKLAEKEHIVATDTDSYLLSNIRLKGFLETDFSEVGYDSTLREMVNIVSTSRRNIFPVLDREGHLKGLITIDDIREIMFKQELYDVIKVKDLVHPATIILTEKDDIQTAMKVFDQTHLWNIPVVYGGLYKGFISKSTILERYRASLINSSVG